MGLLREPTVWTSILNEMMRLSPGPGKEFGKDAAIEIRRMTCGALTKLTHDPELAADVAAARSRTAEGVLDDPSVPNFGDFLDMFLLLEAKILHDRGLDRDAAFDVLHEVRMSTLAPRPSAANFDRLEDKIRYCATLACEGTEDGSPEKPPIWSSVWRATKGIAVLSANLTAGAASVVILLPAGAAIAGAIAVAGGIFLPIGASVVGSIAGTSLESGAKLITSAVRGRW